MNEIQINRFKLNKESLPQLGDTACRCHEVEIDIDTTKDIDVQRRGLVHEIIGAYLGVFIDPDTIWEISDNICDLLLELED